MEQGGDYALALSEAQRAGFAEADPSGDVSGADAGHKLALLIQIAFGLPVTSQGIRRTGIADITRRDSARAQMLGQRIRLVAAAVRTVDGVLAEVAPLLLPENHIFAQTAGVENVVQIVARDAGPLVLRGAGAGGAAAASAVLGDFVSVLRRAADRARCAPLRIPSTGVALALGPLFASLPRSSELPQYSLWNDDLTTGPITHALAL
jgi:homoserine dehydrogenase